MAAKRKVSVAAAKKLIGSILKRMRWDDQGGYPSLHKGKWLFISTSLPQVTPRELNKLFAFAEIVPDEIQPLGDCKDCKYARNGYERGYEAPCLSCTRPKHSNFVPAKKLVRKGKK